MAVFHWTPEVAWECDATDAMDYLDAGLLAEARRASLQVVALFDPERLAQMTSAWARRRAVTLKEQYGEQVAADFSEWESSAKAWLKERR